MKKYTSVLVMASMFFLLGGMKNFVQAADGDVSIATVKIQEILSQARAGIEAQKILQKKAATFQSDIQQEQENLMSLQNQIEMKSSVWTKDIRDEKERDYQRKLRALQMRSEDAKYEFRQLEKKVMEPILKALNDVIVEVGKKNGYTVILANEAQGLASRSGLLYANESLDISNLIVKELNAKLKN